MIVIYTPKKKFFYFLLNFLILKISMIVMLGKTGENGKKNPCIYNVTQTTKKTPNLKL